MGCDSVGVRGSRDNIQAVRNPAIETSTLSEPVPNGFYGARTERNLTIDIARGIGILLVVYGHSKAVIDPKGELFRVIFSFHLPLFFFLAGVFFNPNQRLVELLKSKADSLLKPHFVVMTSIGIAVIGSGEEGMLEYLVRMVWSTGKTIAWATGEAVWVPLWFVAHLFLAYVVCWPTARATRTSTAFTRWTIIAVCLVVGFAISKTLGQDLDGRPISILNQVLRLPGLPFSADLIFITSAYFLAGHYLSDRVILFKAVWYQVVLAAAAFAALHYFFDYTIDLNLRIYDSLFISLVQSVLGIYLVLAASRFLARQDAAVARPIAYVGAGSFFILIFHFPFQLFTFELMQQWLPGLPTLDTVIALMVGTVCPLLLLFVVERSPLLRVLLLPRKRRPSAAAKTDSP